MNGEYYMDWFTDIQEYIERKCPYCGGVLEIFENDDVDNIICPECGSVMNIYQTEDIEDD